MNDLICTGYCTVDVPDLLDHLLLACHRSRTGRRGAKPEPSTPTPVPLSDTMYLLIDFRKSTPPQNRQLDISISNSEQQVDDFVES